MEKIVFFFPWKELSGGPFYLADIAQDLAKDVNYDVYYVDYPDGIAAKYLKCPKVKIVPYGFHESFLNNNRCVLVTPIYCAGHVPVLQDESRILFLNWHNYCITSLINTWKIKRDLQQFLFMVYRTQSVFFLDAAHRAAQNEYVYPKGAYEFNEEYVPIVIKTDIQSKNRRSIVHKTLNLAVLGRLTVDKAFSVLNLLRCLEDSVICTPVKIYIIGDGEAKGILDNYLSTSSLDVEFVGVLSGEALNKFLESNVDVLFGMGRSIFEGAIRKIPSVIIPHNFEEFSCDRFTYLHETKGYALGWYDTQIEAIGVSYHSIEEVINTLANVQIREKYGNEDFQYTYEKHRSNVAQFCWAVANTNLKYKEFKALAKKQGIVRKLGIPIAKVVSSFDERNRVIMLFGIKSGLEYHVEDNVGTFYIFNKKIDFLTIEQQYDRKKIRFKRILR